MADYDIIEAVPGQKNKASVYNTNFGRMKKYVDDSVDELTTETNNTLSVYQNVNSLATSGTIALADNSINTIIPTGNVAFTLPSITGTETNKFHQILVQVSLSDTDYISADDNGLGTDYFYNAEKPRFTYTGNYDVIYGYDNLTSKWCVGVIYKGEDQ